MSDVFHERLSALDASMLGFEESNARWHEAAVMLFDAKPLRTREGGLDFERILNNYEWSFETKHLEGTGVSNTRILENFARLRREFPEARVTVRTPVIPGFNDTETEIRAIANFVRSAGGAQAYELLPYHRFGEAKYEKLGKHYRLSHLRPPSEDRIRELNRIAMQMS